MSPDLSGNPAKLHLRSRVVSCDPSKGTITLEGGHIHKGDLIIAADGVHVSLTFCDFVPKPCWLTLGNTVDTSSNH